VLRLLLLHAHLLPGLLLLLLLVAVVAAGGNYCCLRQLLLLLLMQGYWWRGCGAAHVPLHNKPDKALVAGCSRPGPRQAAFPHGPPQHVGIVLLLHLNGQHILELLQPAQQQCVTHNG
jgi:hypothetical protein